MRIRNEHKTSIGNECKTRIENEWNMRIENERKTSIGKEWKMHCWNNQNPYLKAKSVLLIHYLIPLVKIVEQEFIPFLQETIQSKKSVKKWYDMMLFPKFKENWQQHKHHVYWFDLNPILESKYQLRLTSDLRIICN